MGEVCRATEINLKRQAAIKVPPGHYVDSYALID
jgi:hypothetical protein